MPIWVQIVLSSAAVVTAIGVLWTRFFKPGALLVALIHKLTPLLEELADSFADMPEAFETLSGIAKQFQADSGTSLRDVVNRLEAASIENARASDDNASSARVLLINLEAADRLAAQDRVQVAEVKAHIAHLTDLVNKLTPIVNGD
jgi:hypothetical protein